MQRTTTARPLGWHQLLVFAGVLMIMLAVPVGVLAQDAPDSDGASQQQPKPTHVHEENRYAHLGGATYRVYGYQEGLVGYTTANGHVIQPEDRFVALPCFCALSSKGGNEFQVKLKYGDKEVIAPVWDVGPWNTEDNYWDAPEDRTWQGLPQGYPQAAAAFYEGYNGGTDAWGREVGSPGGIDIGDGTFRDLGMTGSDWLEVTFLWLEPQRYELPPLPFGFENISTVWWDERPPLDWTAEDTSGSYGYFWETGHNVHLYLLNFFAANGGWQRFGLPVSELHRKPEPDGRLRYVQYFERTYMEVDLSGSTDPPAIIIGNVGYDSYSTVESQRYIEPFPETPSARYYAETGHSLQNGFKAYWEANGGVEYFGLPLSEEWSTEVEGRTVVMQLFQRARLEWWPDRVGQPDEITRGLLGVELLRANGYVE